MQPAVVVMTKGGGVSNPSSNPLGGYVNNVASVVIPYMEKTYNVTKEASGRAFAGTSAFGAQANIFMFGTAATGFATNDVSRFGYYGPWSAAGQAPPVAASGQGAPPTAAPYQNPALKNLLGIHVAIGAYDLGGNAPMLTAITERQGLQNAGVPFRWYSVDGGHTFTFWRLALHDFLTHVAFRATTTKVVVNGGTLTATIASATMQPVVPTGSVQFLSGDQPLGAAVVLVNGTATLTGRTMTIGTSLAAVYSGDMLYNPSTSTAVTYSAAVARNQNDQPTR
jgi:hypothetical protein